MTKPSLADQDIIDFLSRNPDFFVQNPGLLEELKVNSKSGSVTSLIHHQVNVLQDRNAQLKTKLYELINRAEDNEKLMSHVFELTLQLSQISHVANVTKHFVRFVKQHFNPDLFKLVLPAYDNVNNSPELMCLDEDKSAEFINLFDTFIKNGQPIAGRLKKDKLTFIFGRRTDEIGSCVILPIGKQAQKGVLAFASFDENRFNPEVSTDLLSRLTQILDRKLNRSFAPQQTTQQEINEPD